MAVCHISEGTKMPKIKQDTIDNLAPPKTGQRFVWNSAVRGFGFRITASGARAFVLQYRSPETGKTRRKRFASSGGGDSAE